VKEKLFALTAIAGTSLGLLACNEEGESVISQTSRPTHSPVPTKTFAPQADLLFDSHQVIPIATSSSSGGGLGGIFPGVPEIDPTPTPSPVSFIIIPPTETPTAIPTLEPTPIPRQEFVEKVEFTTEEWKDENIVSEIDFGNINGKKIKLENISGEPVIPAPLPEGVLSPYPVLPMGVSNVVDVGFENLEYALGHSMVSSVRQPIADIEYLELGDFAIVKDQDGKNYPFSVADIAISGLSQDEARSFIKSYSKTNLLLQTSLVYWDGRYLLDPENKDNLIEKAGGMPADVEDRYKILLIILQQVDTPILP
jgi:hypothetical protein